MSLGDADFADQIGTGGAALQPVHADEVDDADAETVEYAVFGFARAAGGDD